MKFPTPIPVLIILLLALFSCERVSEKNQYTLKGQLVKSCEDPMGVANIRLGLLAVDKGQAMSGGSGVEWLAHTRTDAGGHFELTYEGDIHSNVYLKYYPKLGSMLMMGIPRNQNLDLGLVYYGRQEVDLIIKAKTSYSFSEYDTLKMGHAASVIVNGYPEFRKIPGPFYDGQLLAKIEDYEGTVQVYIDNWIENQKLMDFDYIHGLGYYFVFPNDRYYSYITVPCKDNILEIPLDSMMLNP